MLSLATSIAANRGKAPSTTMRIAPVVQSLCAMRGGYTGKERIEQMFEGPAPMTATRFVPDLMTTVTYFHGVRRVAAPGLHGTSDEISGPALNTATRTWCHTTGSSPCAESTRASR